MNINVTDMRFANYTQTLSVSWLQSNGVSSDTLGTVKFRYINTNPWAAVPSILILVFASVVGTGGNTLTLLAIAMFRKLRNEDSVFITNLALSDLFVTVVADPMSAMGKYSHILI